MRFGERSEKPSKAAAVVFRREDGWTPAKARKWLIDHGIARPKKYRTMQSKGGAVLKPGSYIRVPIVSEAQMKKFTSFGYNQQTSYPGVYFQIGGYRKRKAREGVSKVRAIDVDIAHIDSCTFLRDVIDVLGSGWQHEPAIAILSNATVVQMNLGKAAKQMCGPSLTARDHLGPTGRYWIEYIVNNQSRRSGPWRNKGEVDQLESYLKDHGFSIEQKYEETSEGDRLVV